MMNENPCGFMAFIIRFRWFLGVIAFAWGSIVFPQGKPLQLLQYPRLEGAGHFPQKAFRVGAFPIAVDADALKELPLRSTASLTLPNQQTYQVVYDQTRVHPSGSRSFIGYLKECGISCRIVLTYSAEGQALTGMVKTLWAEYVIEPYVTDDGNTMSVLVEQKAAGLEESLTPDHMPTITPEKLHWEKLLAEKGTLRQKEEQEASNISTKVVSATPRIIDVLVLYNQDFALRYGKAVNTRIDYLTTIANQAYLDSDIDLEVRVVHVEQIDYLTSNSNGVALEALATGSDPAFARVAALRDQFGADLVSLMRPFDNKTQQGCGIAYVTGADGLPMSLFEDAAYSVVSDGADGRYYCVDYTFAHELGHNMGLAHDRANSAGITPSWPFAFGYGVSGQFGSIMSYLRPIIGRFSNPDLVCAGSPCGISEGLTGTSANNRLALTRNKDAVANYRATKVPPIVPQDGWWWNPKESGRGFMMQVSNGQLFLAGFLYSEDGRADWVTAMGPLWADGVRATLATFKNCQTLTGPYKTPVQQPSPGAIYVHFSDATHGTVVWPGGSLSIERFDIIPQGTALPKAASQPPAGLLWDPNRSGTGFAVEIQGGNLFMVAFVCNEQGNPDWYLTSGPMASKNTYEGSWVQLGGGQTLLGKYQSATVTNSDVGKVRLEWSSPMQANLTLPNGKTVALSRFNF